MLECVVNLSEGVDRERLRHFAELVAPLLLDVHADGDHNRAVMTIAGPSQALHEAVADLTRAAVATLDLAGHRGVHPRLGVVDVVPFVDLDDPSAGSTPRSLAARDRFVAWAADELGLPSFVYGPERTLPEVRRGAWRTLAPTAGPGHPHPTAGAVCVGARGVLVAYNLVTTAPIETGQAVAAALRRPGLRVLALGVGAGTQISCNLTDPARLGPADAYDLAVRALTVHGAAVTAAELVGLVPASVLAAIPQERWTQLDVGPDRTIEARLTRHPA